MDIPVDSRDVFVTASTALRKTLRNCIKCNKMIPIDSKFCPECGAFLNW
jgi:rRNA maturation endonuclease Nob1